MTIAEKLNIPVGTLAAWLKEKKPVTLLDVRPLKEREEWSIPGSVHADVYDKLKAGDAHALDDLALERNTPVVAFCAGGKTSLLAAEKLRQRGYDAYSLAGGMKAWNYAWNTAEVVTASGARIIQVRRSAKGCLSYLVGSAGEAIVIDASLDPQVYLDIAHEHGWTITLVTDTHIHADFISRSRELAAASQARHILFRGAQVDFAFHPVGDGEIISLGNASLTVLHTPGHTWESTSFKLGDAAVFTGDTLFVDGIGRPDLKAEQDEAVKKSGQLYHSLHRLLGLEPRMRVFPAHVSSAVPFDNKPVTETLENLERKLGPLLLREDEFVRHTLSRIPPAPPNYLTIAELNRKVSYEGYQPAELEAGANRCAIA